VFLTTLHVAHVDANTWKLTSPLVWEGNVDYFVIRKDFLTDFASIPKPIRWLLDSSGGNSEAAVLHDAVWRESKKKSDGRVDPWDADGMFRRALRETGTPALTRGIMWFGVRVGAVFGGRFGVSGPPIAVKLLQLIGMLVVGVFAVLGPTLVAAVGLVVYWLINWLISAIWILYERRRKFPTNLPWPLGGTRRGRNESTHQEPPHEYLNIVGIDDPRAPGLLDLIAAGNGVIEDDAVEQLLGIATPPPPPEAADRPWDLG
jgi:hypothetical protein